MQIIEVKNQIVSTIALIDDENKILIGKRPVGKVFENLFTNIYKILKNNGFLIFSIFGTKTMENVNFIIFLFISRKWNLEPIRKFHTELKWVKANDLNNYNMPPANKFLVTSLQDLLL